MYKHMKFWNKIGKQDSISEALCLSLPKHAVISVTGAGGKTSLIFSWAGELAAAGKKVVVTTTTHMLHPGSAGDFYTGRAVIYHSDYKAGPAALAEDFAEIDALLRSDKILMLASKDPANERKVVSPPEEIFDYALSSADVVLIEADGSRSMPLKLPKSHEPVVPEYSYATVCVAGLSSLGRRIEDVLYGSEDMPEIDRIASVEVDEAFIAALLSSPSGGAKGAAGEFRVYLNQADTPELQEKAAHISELLSLQNIQCAWGTLK